MALERNDGEDRGTRVTETGIALVHAGEVILPAPGSEAGTEQLLQDSRTVVEYYFPVEIEVRAAPDPIDPDEIVDRALRALGGALGVA
jgi:hypothetical protein